jgi:hypothetical protein
MLQRCRPSVALAEGGFSSVGHFDPLRVRQCLGVVAVVRKAVSLASRPGLFELARALGEGWPGDVPRDVLLARAFGAKLADESHRAR